MANVTSKDAVFIFVADQLNYPTVIKGFAKDAMIEFDNYEDVETDIGADGQPIEFSKAILLTGKFTLQPTSETIPFIESIQTAQKNGYPVTGTLTIQYKSINKVWILTNFVIKSGIRPFNAKARLEDIELAFSCLPSAPTNG